jgi:uncharacterized protein HemX
LLHVVIAHSIRAPVAGTDPCKAPILFHDPDHQMNEFTENENTEGARWSITAWALLVALGIGLAGTVIAGSDKAANQVTATATTGS